MRTLVWFRGKDLRVADHGPLRQAVEGGGLIPVFCLDPFFFAPARARALPHRMAFLLDGLRSLQANLAHLGSRLIVVEGRAVERIPELAARWRVDRVSAQAWVEPFARERDRRVAAALGAHGIPFDLHDGATLVPPGSLRTQAGAMFGVFTPFARAFARAAAVPSANPAPRALPPLPAGLEAVPEAAIPTLADLGIPENPRLVRGGEKAARARLKAFLAGPISRYREGRNRMDWDATSRLSADLKFGTLSPAAVWWAVAERFGAGHDADVDAFLNELVWREFAHHLLWDRPDLLEHPFKPAWEGFPWLADEAGFEAWSEGRTGYPVVDAAARQLKAEGFVHNRARMVAASFLTKDLRISWRRGEAHYLRWLVDGDWAPNNAGWQWSAGCGCDAQPWFRIFNPASQGRRFDPDGDYVRRWVPELAGLDARWIHAPWEAPEDLRRGLDYPAPILDHARARADFLAAAKAHLGGGRPPGGSVEG
ncbi:MAG: deoxyribodipyrimidine photo-lyase [Holophagaceae bacterium]